MYFTIRRLTQDDWEIYKKVRLDALRDHPEAFGGSYEDQSQLPDTSFQERLEQKVIFGAFVGGQLVGTSGFYSEDGRKSEHRGRLWGMYLQKEFRGQGIADALVKAVIDYARDRSEQLHLAVTTINSSALKLYERHGFVSYGKDPRALKIGTEYYDEYLMALIF